MKDDYWRKHKKLRGHIELARSGELYPDMSYKEKASYFALELTRLGIGYGTGGRYAISNEYGDSATWSRFEKQGDSPPKLECAGFVEMLLYGLGQIEGDIFNYRGLRRVHWDTAFYRRAALGTHDYEENWIPGKQRAATVTELNGMGAWAQTPVLLYFRQEFEPIETSASVQAGDVLSFMSHDRTGYHFHSGVWVQTAHERGLVHSSPSSKWDAKDGPKYTPAESDYYQEFLQPMKVVFARYFGAAATRLKGAG